MNHRYFVQYDSSGEASQVGESDGATYPEMTEVSKAEYEDALEIIKAKRSGTE